MTVAELELTGELETVGTYPKTQASASTAPTLSPVPLAPSPSTHPHPDPLLKHESASATPPVPSRERELKERGEGIERQEGSRRTIAAAFADLSNFTSLSEKMDPEEVRKILNECFQSYGEIIEKYEGGIDKFIGDAVLYIFGFPRTYENDAERAVRAAVEMREITEKVAERYGLKNVLRLKVGINMGLAIHVSVGSKGKQEETVIGDTVNTASRIQSLCSAGQIVVSENIFRKTSHIFQFSTFAEKIKVKGRSEPVSLYELLSSQPAAPTGKSKYLTPFFGREGEILLLQGYLSDIAQGVGRIVGIAGDAGIGKSRLVSEFIERFVNFKEVALYRARCVSFAQNKAYALFEVLLKKIFALADSDPAELAREKIGRKLAELSLPVETTLPYCLRLLGMKSQEPTESENLEELKMLTHQSVEKIILAESKAQPTVILLEDLHWIDSSSYELLNSLIKKISAHPVMLIALYRHGLSHRWMEERGYVQLSLNELSRKDAVKIIAHLLAEESPEQKILDLIFQRSGGNAFFIEEITQSLIETGVVKKRGEHWELQKTGSEAISVSSSIESVILYRMDALPRDVISVLKTASVIGRFFNKKILKEIFPSTSPSPSRGEGRDETEKDEIERSLDRILKNLIERDIIYHGFSGSDEFVFRQSLTQEVIYNSILIEDRKKMHEKIGLAIERLYKEHLQDQIAILAKYFSASNNTEKAIFYLLLAGDKARELFANDSAISNYRSIIELCDKSNNPEKGIAARLHLGTVLYRMGNMEESMQLFQTASDLSIKHKFIKLEFESDFEIARVHWRQGRRSQSVSIWQKVLQFGIGHVEPSLLCTTYYRISAHFRNTGERDKAMDHLNKASAIAQEIGDVGLQVEIMTSKVLIFMYAGEYEPAMNLILEALNIAKPNRLCRHETFLHSQLGLVLYTQGNFEEAIKNFDEAIRLGKQIGDKSNILWTSKYKGELYLCTGCLKECTEEFTRALEIAGEMKHRVAEADLLLLLASCEMRKGNFKIAQEQRKKSLQLASEMNNPFLLAKALLALGSTARDLGETDEAKHFFEKALDTAKSSSQDQNLQKAHLQYGYFIYHSFGDYYNALQHLNLSLEIARKRKDKISILTSLNGLALVLSDLGDIEQADKIVDELLALSREMGQKDLYVYSYSSAARTMRQKGELAKGEEYCYLSLKHAEEIGSPRYLALAHYDLGFVFQVQNKVQQAIEHFKTSYDLYEKSGQYHELQKSLIGLGYLFLKNGERELALKYLGEAERFALKRGQKRYLRAIYFNLGKIAWEDEGGKELALSNFEKAMLVQGEILKPMDEKMRAIYFSVSQRKDLFKDLERAYSQTGKKMPAEIAAVYSLFPGAVGQGTNP